MPSFLDLYGDSLYPASQEEDRPFLSDLYEVGRQGVAGLVVDLPRMAGNVVRRVAPDTSALDEFGRRMVESANERAPEWEPDLQGRGLGAETAIKGARGLGPMLPTLAASFVPGGQFVAPAVAGGMFGLSSAQETEDKLRMQGVPDAQATEAGVYTGLVQGPLEAVAAYPLGRALGAIRPVFSGAKTTGDVYRRLVDTSVARPLAKNFGLNLLAQPATEVAQDVGTEFIERAYGAQPENAWEIAKESAQAAVGLTALLGPFAAGASIAQSKQAKALDQALLLGTPQVRQQAESIVVEEARRARVPEADIQQWLQTRNDFFRNADAVAAAEKANEPVDLMDTGTIEFAPTPVAPSKPELTLAEPQQTYDNAIEFEPQQRFVPPPEPGGQLPLFDDGGFTLAEPGAPIPTAPRPVEAQEPAFVPPDRSTPLFDEAPTSTVRTDFGLPQVQDWITRAAGREDAYAKKLAKFVSDNIDSVDQLEEGLLNEVDRVGRARTTTKTAERRLAALQAALDVTQRYREQMARAQGQETNIMARRAIPRARPGAVVGPVGPQPNFTEQMMRERAAQELAAQEQAAQRARFESDLETTDARVAAARERQAAENRAAVLQRVLDANPAPGTVLMRFNQALRNEGIQQLATPREAAAIKRYIDIVKAQPGTRIDARRELLDVVQEAEPEKATRDQGKWYEKQAKKAPAKRAIAARRAPATTPTAGQTDIVSESPAPAPVLAPAPASAQQRAKQPRVSPLEAALRALAREADAEPAAKTAPAPVPVPAPAPALTPKTRGGMRRATLDRRSEELAQAREELAQAEARFSRIKALPQNYAMRKQLEDEYFEAAAKVRRAERAMAGQPAKKAGQPGGGRLITAAETGQTATQRTAEEIKDAMQAPKEGRTANEETREAIEQGLAELESALARYNALARGTSVYDRAAHDQTVRDAAAYIQAVAEDKGEPKAVRDRAKAMLEEYIDPKDLPLAKLDVVEGRTTTPAAFAYNAIEALQVLRERMGRKYHPLIDKLARLPRMSEVEVKFGGKLESSDERYYNKLGEYDWNERVLTVGRGAQDKDVLHELLHAATAREMSRHFQGRRLQPVTAEAQELVRLMEQARALAEQRGVQDAYAFKNVFEFVAEAFSNPEFQQMLESDVKVRSLWGRFKDWVRKLLGRPIGERTLFDEVAKAVEPFMQGPGAKARYVADRQTTVANEELKKWGIPDPVETKALESAWNTIRAGITDWRNNPSVLGWLSLRQLDQRFGKNDEDGTGSELVSKYIRAALNAERRAKEITADASKPINAWRNLPEKDQVDLGRVMLEATMARAHVGRPFDDKANEHLHPNVKGLDERQAKAAWDKAEAEFNRVKKMYDDLVARSPRTKEIYAAVRDAAQRQWEAMSNARINEIIRAYRPALSPYFSQEELESLVRTPAKLREDMKQLASNAGMKPAAKKALRDLLDAAETHYEEVGQMKGPYFPIVRFGDHVVVVKSDAFKRTHAEYETARQNLQDLYDTEPPTDEIGEADFYEQIDEAKRELRAAREKVELLKGSERHYLVEFYEHRWEAENRAKQLAAAQKAGAMDKTLSVAVEQRNKHYQQFDSASPHFIRKLEEELRRTLPKADAGAVQNAVRELYLRTLPDRSALKSELRRLNVAGAKPSEMMRGFATRSVANAHRISRMEYGGEMQDALNGMRGSDDVDTMLVGEEFAKRLIKTLGEPRRNVVFERLAQGAHLTFLGMSPSYLLINAAQPWAISVPIMGMKHGITRSAVELGKASSEVFGAMRNMRTEEAKNLKGAGIPWSQARSFRFDLDIDKLGKTEGERAMLRQLYNDGLIDITIEHDMGAVATGAEENWFDKVNQIASTPAHLVEVLNRVATSLAAYRLEMGRDASEARQEAAVRYATDVVGDTHLDYGAENAPRLMRPDSLGGLGRIVWQFKKYLQGMLYLQAKLLKGAFKGDRKALMGLAYLNGMVVGVSGMVGLPIAGGVGMLATAIAQLWEDDDEPDFGQMFYNGLKDVAGETVAQLLWKGAPAAMGIDLSQRMSMSFAPLPFVDWNKSGRDLYADILVNLGGPASAMMANWFDAARVAANDPVKAATLAIPKVLADPLRAYQMAEQGVRSRAGAELISPEELNAAQISLRALGFQPTKVADMYETRASLNVAKKRQADMRNRLIQRFKDARRRNEDATDVMRDIASFNRRNPANRITQATLLKSLQRDLQNQRYMKGGAIISPREADVLGRVGLTT